MPFLTYFHTYKSALILLNIVYLSSSWNLLVSAMSFKAMQFGTCANSWPARTTPPFSMFFFVSLTFFLTVVPGSSCYLLAFGTWCQQNVNPRTTHIHVFKQAFPFLSSYLISHHPNSLHAVLFWIPTVWGHCHARIMIPFPCFITHLCQNLSTATERVSVSMVFYCLVIFITYGSGWKSEIL